MHRPPDSLAYMEHDHLGGLFGSDPKGTKYEDARLCRLIAEEFTNTTNATLDSDTLEARIELASLFLEVSYCFQIFGR